MVIARPLHTLLGQAFTIAGDGGRRENYPR